MLLPSVGPTSTTSSPADGRRSGSACRAIRWHATLLVAFGRGLAAPSANRFGKVSPTTAQHVLDDLGDRLDPALDLVLDGGPCEVGVESTIVDLT